MPSDKVLHFIAGAIVSVFASYLFGAMTGFLIALAVGAVIGATPFLLR